MCTDNEYRPTVTVRDVVYNINQLKCGKAPGLDSITAEHLYFAHTIVAVLLTIMFNSCLKICYVPSAFADGVIIPLFN